MKIHSIFTVSLLIGAVIISSCAGSSSDDKKEQPVVVVGKPLPVDCADQSQLTLSWPSDAKAYNYSVSQGFQNGVFDIKDSFDATQAKEGVTIALDRGAHTYFQVTKEKVNGSQHLETFDFYVPTCSERPSWREKHPEYEEPTAIVLDWI